MKKYLAFLFFTEREKSLWIKKTNDYWGIFAGGRSWDEYH